jgi:6-phosphogluconolactonase
VIAPHWHISASLELASQAMAQWVAEQIHHVLSIKPRVVVAVPGGSTPELFLTRLAGMPLDWSRITLMPTDERCVPAGHPRSNEAMLRRVMAPLAAQQCQFVSFLAVAAGGQSAADVVSARVVASGLPDIVVSGMGEDAHIASLFPEDPSWIHSAAATDGPQVMATRPPDLEPRMSLAPHVLAQAPARGLLISGDAKRKILDNALKQTNTARYPVLLLAGQERMFHVFCT